MIPWCQSISNACRKSMYMTGVKVLTVRDSVIFSSKWLTRVIVDKCGRAPDCCHGNIFIFFTHKLNLRRNNLSYIFPKIGSKDIGRSWLVEGAGLFDLLKHTIRACFQFSPQYAFSKSLLKESASTFTVIFFEILGMPKSNLYILEYVEVIFRHSWFTNWFSSFYKMLDFLKCRNSILFPEEKRNLNFSL